MLSVTSEGKGAPYYGTSSSAPIDRDQVQRTLTRYREASEENGEPTLREVDRVAHQLADMVPGLLAELARSVPTTSGFSRWRDHWHDLNRLVGEASPGGCEERGEPLDRAKLAELLDARAYTWLQLGQEIDDDRTPVVHVYAVACHYAAQLDHEDAARHRYAGGVPSLFPGVQVQLLHLQDARCGACGRPWQLDTDGRCDQCPRLMFGHPDAAPETWAEVDPAKYIADQNGLGWEE